MKKNYSIMVQQLKMKKAVSFLALAFMASINLNAQTATTWIGTNTDFLNTVNWSGASIPNGSSDVTIVATSNNPIYNANLVTVDAANTGNYISHLNGASGNPLTVSASLQIWSGGGNYGGGDFNIETGGTMNFRNTLYLGITNNPSVVNVNGGILNVKSIFLISQNGDCTININSGTVSVDGGTSGQAITIGAYTGNGVVNLKGGFLKTNPTKTGTAALSIDEQPTRIGTGLLKIDGGTLEMGGDQRTFINGYVTAGKIVAGVGKTIVATFDSVTNLTSVIASAPLGIDSKSLDSIFSVYPNPSRGLININAKSNDLGSLNVSVYNLLGQQVLSSAIEGNNSGVYSLDASNKLAPGTYIVKIQSGSSNYSSKIVVE